MNPHSNKLPGCLSIIFFPFIAAGLILVMLWCALMITLASPFIVTRKIKSYVKKAKGTSTPTV